MEKKASRAKNDRSSSGRYLVIGATGQVRCSVYHVTFLD